MARSRATGRHDQHVDVVQRCRHPAMRHRAETTNRGMTEASGESVRVVRLTVVRAAATEEIHRHGIGRQQLQRIEQHVGCLGRDEATGKRDAEAVRGRAPLPLEWGERNALMAPHEPVGRNSEPPEHVRDGRGRREKRSASVQRPSCVATGPRLAARVLARRQRRSTIFTARSTASAAPGTGRFLTNRADAYERTPASAPGRDTASASVFERPGASRTVEIEQLPAMARQPVVVEREGERNAACCDFTRQVHRQARQVLNVHRVRRKLIDRASRDAQQLRVAVTLLEVRTELERVVDTEDRHTSGTATAQFQFGPTRIPMTRQHGDFGVRQRGKRVGEVVYIDFGATMCHWWEAMNDQHDAHQMRPVRSHAWSSREERAPRYCPTGTATPSAALRTEARRRPVFSCAASWTFAGTVTAIALSSAGTLGIVVRPKSA